MSTRCSRLRDPQLQTASTISTTFFGSKDGTPGVAADRGGLNAVDLARAQRTSPVQPLIDSPVITFVLPHSGHCVSVPIGGDSTSSHSELPDSALNPHRWHRDIGRLSAF